MKDRLRASLIGIGVGIVTILLLIYLFYYVLPFEDVVFVYIAVTAGLVVSSAVECVIAGDGVRSFVRRASISVIVWTIAYLLIVR